MKKRILLNAVLTGLMMVSLPSCKKKGCMDSVAKNYSTEAQKDDGTCEYYTREEFLTMDKWIFSSVSTTADNLTELQAWFLDFDITYDADGTYVVNQPADTDTPTTNGVWEFHEQFLAVYHDKGTADESILNLDKLDIDNMDVIMTEIDSAGVQQTTMIYLIHE